MKILLYTEGLKAISKSGLGKAIKHQKKALEDNKVEYTTNLKDDFDILHINFYGPKSYFFARKAKREGKKIVYHAHSTEEDFRNSFLFSNLVSPLFKKWLIKCYSLGDVIVTPTEYSKRLLSNYHMNPPIKAISNGVDTKFFEKDEQAGLEFREKYGYTKDDKVIVGIGLYIKRKGILDFVELAKRLPDYKFIWFGHSPLWASPKEIREAVHTKLPNLHFAGYVESSVIKSALSGADLYLFPTLEETEGIPIIEALTSKIPTLIRDIPVFEEYEANKVVYKAKDIDEFERKIEKILDGKLPNLTEAGYKEAKKKDVKTVGKELIHTYKEVLEMPTDYEKLEEEKKTRKKNHILLGAVLIGLIAMTIALFTIKDNKVLEEYTKVISAMDTKIKVSIYSNSKKKAEKALDEVENIYLKYDRLTDRKEGTELYKIHNNNEKGDIVIDGDLYQLLKYGKKWYDISGGALNIHTGDLVDIWAPYRKKKNGIPDKAKFKKINTNIKDIELLGKNTLKNNHANIDLSNIRMGYATDEVVRYLKEEKLNSYFINASYLIVAGDYFEKDGKYVVAIASPFKDNTNEVLTNISFTNGVIVTKAMYQNAYEYKGKNYGGILDSKTNYPANHAVSVTVIGRDIADSEALATSLFLMSMKEGSEFMKKNTNFEAMWAYYDGKEEKKGITPDFYNYFLG